MVATATGVKKVSVIATGAAETRYEHVNGSRMPSMWWILFGNRRVRLPINVYVVEHDDGLVLFDTGQEQAVMTDPDYYGDRITGFIMNRIFNWEVGPEDTLAIQLAKAGYAVSDVTKAVISHLHGDHVGNISEIPRAELYASADAREWLHATAHPERKMVYRERIEVPGAKWNWFKFEPTDDSELSPFTQPFDLMGDGSMMLLPTPGHMAGSTSMLVRRRTGAPLLFVGDLTYSEDLLMNDHLPGIGDGKVLLRTFAKVRELKERMPGLVILPAHDLDAVAKLAAAA